VDDAIVSHELATGGHGRKNENLQQTGSGPFGEVRASDAPYRTVIADFLNLVTKRQPPRVIYHTISPTLSLIFLIV
jgi:hypothetical protein